MGALSRHCGRSGGLDWLRRALAFLVLFLTALPAAWAQVPVPPLTARVTDLTATLEQNQKDSLEKRLADFEKQKGAQIGVLLVPTVKPESIEQYGIRVAEAWKLGRKGVDDGLILLVAKNDREVRIEVGYGLEGVVPDAIAKRIIEEDIVPRFRAGDLAGGLDAGVTRLMAVVSGEPLPPPIAPRAQGGGSSDLLFPLLVVAVIFGAVLRAVLGRMVAAGASGGVAALVAGLMGASLLGIAGVGVGVFLFVLFGQGGAGGLGGRGGSGWSSGGGFSGGGGGFGGGGASGRW